MSLLIPSRAKRLATSKLLIVFLILLLGSAMPPPAGSYADGPATTEDSSTFESGDQTIDPYPEVVGDSDLSSTSPDPIMSLQVSDQPPCGGGTTTQGECMDGQGGRATYCLLKRDYSTGYRLLKYWTGQSCNGVATYLKNRMVQQRWTRITGYPNGGLWGNVGSLRQKDCSQCRFLQAPTSPSVYTWQNIPSPSEVRVFVAYTSCAMWCSEFYYIIGPVNF